MDTSKGEERPSPPPKPGVNRPLVDRPKTSRRVPARPQPPRPKRPPVAAKPATSTSPTSNGVHPETGSPPFPRTPPPLPSIPPCATPRDDVRPVPTPRRISYILANSTEDSVSQLEHSEPAKDEPVQQDRTPSERSGVVEPHKGSLLGINQLDGSVKLPKLPDEEPVQEPNMPESPHNVIGMNPVGQAVAAGLPRPKPPLKPQVKPKPKIKSKPLCTAVQKEKSAAATKPQKSKVVVEQSKPDVLSVEVCDHEKGGNEPVQGENTDTLECLGDVKGDSQTRTGSPVMPAQTIIDSDAVKDKITSQSDTEHLQCNRVKGGNSANVVPSCSLETPGSNEMPTRPPRKSRLDKTLSQVSVSAGSNEDLSIVPPTTLSPEQTLTAPIKELRKQDSAASNNLEGQVKTELKRRPSRKAPPPPLSTPKKSVDLTEAVSTPQAELRHSTAGIKTVRTPKQSVDLAKAVSTPQTELRDSTADTRTVGTPKQSVDLAEAVSPPQAGLRDSTADIRTVGNRQNTRASERKVSVEWTNVLHDANGNKSRDSSPQPGKLNIRGLEASMGLSIGKGMQHQMTARTRPKAKPPVLSPKPKLGTPQGSDSRDVPSGDADGSKAMRNPSYTQAVQTPKSSDPPEHAQEMSKKLADVTQNAMDKVFKFNRNNSYSRALDELEVDAGEVSIEKDKSCDQRDSLVISGVTVAASTDDEALPLTVESETSPKKQHSLAAPGLVKVLPTGLNRPTDLNLSGLKVKTDTDTDKTSLPKSSQMVADNDIEVDIITETTPNVEGLLNVETSDTGGVQNSSSPGSLKNANNVEDDIMSKTDSLKDEKPMFVPPPPPPYSDLNVNEDIQVRNKALQCPSSGEETKDRSSNELDDQVFVEEKHGNTTDDDYEAIELPAHLRIEESDSDDPDHIYEAMPVLPPKIHPRQPSDNIDVPPVRPPKRSRPHRPVPPTPPVLSPPTTPMSPSGATAFGTPPLPPRRHQLASPGNSPVLGRSPSDMYDAEGYFQPVHHVKPGEIYSYADLPDYPFEKKKTVKKKASPVPEHKLQGAEFSTPPNRESAVSLTSDRTSGDSHIYEPIGSALGSLTRENPIVSTPEQRISGKSIFYRDIDAEDKKQTEASGGGLNVSEDLHSESLTEACKPSRTDSQQKKVAHKAPEKTTGMSVPLSPQAPPRLMRLQMPEGSTASAHKPRKAVSVISSSSDDYIYPEDLGIVHPENPAYKKEGEESRNQTNESIYHEPDVKNESIYHEPDEADEIIYHEPSENNESIYNEAEDSAVDCNSGSASEVVSPSSPPPVPPRDHHCSEPVPQAIRQALYLQRQASALSDNRLNKKLIVVPKTVSFESQLTDSALSLSPASVGALSPLVGKPVMTGLKQRSISNPVMGHKRKVDDSFQEDSTSNSSERPSSWASSGDGFEDLSDIRRLRSQSEDTGSVTFSEPPDSAMYAHGSGSDRSDISDTDHGEWLKEKSEKREKKIFNIACEIMTSEETFVDILKLLNIDFRHAMTKATELVEHEIVPSSVMNQILQYLPQVQNFNEELLTDLKERITNWDNNPRIADIFLRKGPFLKMYTFYIREFENSMAAMDDARKKYTEFDTAVKDFEASDRCKHLLIKHYMLKPIQRIPQYKLLLQEYKKYLTPNHVDFKDTEAALVIVSEVAEHANQSMKYGDNFKKLWEIQSALIGQFEVIHPGRAFIKEGMLDKLSRKVMQPRMFFLLSDVLLYTTPVSGGYKLNNHINLAGTRVILPTKEDFQNEMSIISTERSFTVSASTAAERDEWLTTLRTAIKENAKRRSSFDVRKLHKMPSVLVEVEKDLTLGTRAPVWVPDARVSMCMVCTAEFSVTFRRHHCRACGKVVCGYCSDYRAPLRYLVYKAARVCSECYRKLSKDFDQNDLPDISTSVEETSLKDSTFSRSSIKARFRGISWGSYRKASKAKRPAVLQEVTANDEVAEMSGYLKVWKARKWKKLWFVLKGKALYTFKASEDAAATESIVLLGYEVQTFDSWFEGVEPSLVFEIRHMGTPPKILRTESSTSRDKWLNAIREATMP